MILILLAPECNHYSIYALLLAQLCNSPTWRVENRAKVETLVDVLGCCL